MRDVPGPGASPLESPFCSPAAPQGEALGAASREDGRGKTVSEIKNAHGAVVNTGTGDGLFSAAAERDPLRVKKQKKERGFSGIKGKRPLSIF